MTWRLPAWFLVKMLPGDRMIARNLCLNAPDRGRDSTSESRGIDEFEQVFVARRLFQDSVDAKLEGPRDYGW
jgi:hypothetical protein